MRRLLLVAALIGFVLPAVARADGQFDLSIGYAHQWLEGSDRFEQRDGIRFEPRISFGLEPTSVGQLRLGFGFGISGYTHQLDTDTVITIDNGHETHVIFADQWESLSYLEPEFQISWRLSVAGHDAWIIEPGLGLGAAIAQYAIVDDWWWDGDHDSEWDATWSVRPFLRIAYNEEHWMVGLETSYMFGGNLDLTDQVHGDVREFYAGAFFGFKW